MKVLWLEITQPSGYLGDGKVSGGWQDALENVVKDSNEIDLYIAFETSENSEIKKKNGVTYIPIHTTYSFWERKSSQWSWKTKERKLVSGALQVIEEVKPDLIHVFGNEWPFGLVAETTKIPVVIHIQGSIVPYNNALFPPGYSKMTMFKYAGGNPMRYWRLWKYYKLADSNLEMEMRTWKIVHHYMGRTCWDHAIVNTLSHGSNYYHVDEALRPSFLQTTKRWGPKQDGKLRLITIGFSNFWKGPDMLLKTAHILKDLNVDFEWKVAGRIDPYQKHVVESREGLTFADNNVNILGFTKPEELVDILCNSSMYVHTAYIENSPNSICEAQYLGLPIVSTHVGGIETLLNAGKDGKLVPSNDPWTMANEILSLFVDSERCLLYSNRSFEHAHQRHSPTNIYRDLLNCYNKILNDND